MSKNKYPEVTREKILDVARQLFYEKGYDATSLKDIIDGLGGMTKGVIYHHFKSKQDILENVINSFGVSDERDNWYENWQGETGLEKIRMQIMKSLQNLERHAILYSAVILLKSPRMIGEMYLSSLNESAGYLQVYIDEGIADGSIVTEYPKELSEFISLTMDLWLGLNIVKYTKEELKNKMRFLQHAFQSINVPLIDDSIVEKALKLHDYIQSRK